MSFATTQTGSPRLYPWSTFAALIASAGLPIYIHAPKFYVDNHSVGLTALGGTLALLRLVDVVQDPLLGWLAERGRGRRGTWVALAVALMVLAMMGLFAVRPPITPLAWFALTLTLLFSSYSFLTICFYAQGVEMAGKIGPEGHLRLAWWREAGSLAGVSAAAVAPVALLSVTGQPFTAFALLFALLAALALWVMRDNWQSSRIALPALSHFRDVLADPTARKLLLLALVNSAPVAVTSTLFLFFVESRLGLATYAGAFLLLFFVSAALSTWVWGVAGTRIGPKRSLGLGMMLSITGFLWASVLIEGQGIAFAVVCSVSGAALGADMVLLPALFSRRLGQIGGEAAGFGLWSFVSKLSLAVSAAILLPTLAAVGFTPGAVNSANALHWLSLLYAVLPCALKLLAFLMLNRLQMDKD